LQWLYFFTAPEIVASLCLGAAFGIADAAAIHFPALVTDQIAFVPNRIWVIVPLLWMCACLIGSSVLMLTPLRRRAFTILLAAAAALFLTVRVIVPFRISYPLHATGATVLWFGIGLPALACAAWINRNRLVVRSRFGGMAIVAWVLFAAAMIGSADWPRRPNRVIESGQEPLRPNVVLVFLDTVRYDASGMDGNRDEAPEIARFASTSMVYENAYAPFSWTLPSHVAMLTGKDADAVDVGFEQQTYTGGTPTLAEVLRRTGYETSALFSNACLNPGSGLQRGFETFEYSRNDLDLCRSSIAVITKVIPGARVPLCRLTADDVTDRAVHSIATARRPYFLALNYMDVHVPHYVPRRYRKAGYRPFEPLSEYPKFDAAYRSGEALSADELQNFRSNYATAIQFLDQSVGELIRAVDSSPDGGNTIIAIVGDHGEQFGEHGFYLHGNSVYRQVLHVPLALRIPGVRPHRIAAAVSTSWLYATLLNSVGVKSIARALPLDDNIVAEPVVSRFQALRRDAGTPLRIAVTRWSVALGRLHYIRGANGEEELYDTAEDPDEIRSLTGEQRWQPNLAVLRRIVAERFAGRAGADEHGHSIRSLGYMQ
jgi:arylsulfatase A-like enzyme